jgi:hypothetical protein
MQQLHQSKGSLRTFSGATHEGVMVKVDEKNVYWVALFDLLAIALIV